MQGSQRHSIRRLAPHESSQLRGACALPRLAAIAEELVCNSIDAGATDIAVSLDLASFAVAVRDNGRGMTESELRVVGCLLYTSPSPRDKRQSRMPSSA